MPSNPFMGDGGQNLSQLLMALGSGFSMASAANQPWWAGIGPAAGLYGQAQQQAEDRAYRQQQIEQNNQYRQLQEQALRAQIEDKEAARKARMGFRLDDSSAPGSGTAPASTPGLAPPVPKPTMGGGQNIPQDYARILAGYEGGTKNGGMVYNELGSGAGGPFQIMPATWADIRAKNADLNLPEVMPVDSKPETFAMHRAAFDRFTQGNAQVLQSAGLQPTPENLYLAHRFGAGGAIKMLQANPNAMLADVLPIEWQKQNPDMRGQTVGGFQRLATERMGGVGVPYRANGEVTPYENGVPTISPVVAPPPSIDPVPPPSPVVLAGGQAPVPMTPGAAPQTVQPQNPLDAAGQPPVKQIAPLPPLPPQFKAQLEAEARLPGSNLDAIRQRAYTIQKDLQARAQAALDADYENRKAIWEKKYGFADKTSAEQRQIAAKIEEEKRAAEREAARRAEDAKGEGSYEYLPDGRKVWISKADRAKGGIVVGDKPDKDLAPGTPTGDIAVLERGDPASREYYAAFNRVQSRMVDGPDGIKYVPNMAGYRPPTFQPDAPAAAGADATGMVPVGGGKAVAQGENDLRGDFEKSPVVKAYNVVVPMLESAKDAATRPTRAADINLVYAFAKLMDPDSVVRESETGMVTATGTVGDRLSGYLGQLNGGPMLREETRKKLIAELESRFGRLQESYDAYRDAYTGIAKRRGYNVENVIIPIRKDKPKPTVIDLNGGN